MPTMVFDFRDREARAAKLAREIEGTTSSHLAAELENGDDDEENAFSAVVRDPGQSKDHYYSRNMPSTIILTT